MHMHSFSVMHQPYVTTAPPLLPHPTYVMGGDSMAYVRGSDLSSSPTVSGKCQSCDIITQIDPCGNYYYKEQGYDSQQVPAVKIAENLDGYARHIVLNLKLPLVQYFVSFNNEGSGKTLQFCTSPLKPWPPGAMLCTSHLKREHSVA